MDASEDKDRIDDPEGEPEGGGPGQDGTIPIGPDGVAAGHTGTPPTFERDEDEQAKAFGGD